MKKLMVILVVIIAFMATGCAGLRSAKLETSPNGRKISWADKNLSFLQPSVTPSELAQAQLSQVYARALKEGENPEITGFMGIIKNNTRQTVNLRISGPEERSYFLGPKEVVKDYLLPGDYLRVMTLPGGKIVKQFFKVGPERHYFNGQLYYWYVAFI